MKIKILCTLLLALLLASCGEYNKILKSRDAELKYTYAKKYFDEKKYGRTTTLLDEILSTYTGSSKEQEILFLMAQAYFYDKDYTTATQYYTRYYNKFPKGDYTELARFNAAYGLYLDSPDARLDQTSTIKGIQEFQSFLEYFPQSEKAPEAQDLMFKLQEKLSYKEFLAARLYFNLGLYMGNNYEACIVTSREALKNYPFSEFSEEFQILIVRSRYELAYYSIEEKKPTRYRELMDEHFNYKNMFPSGKYLKESERYYRQALKALGQEVDQVTNEAVQQELSK
ncbi:MAG: outer membrane protein assembly factor BamD [Dysgonomonas sp.]|jgi:outer membrane protein assembly factor BamD|uniref:outer membrane protein assembly factor BamD n=1 Tax=unclassified Dysgonomonas TaxID=2630389 RepID=UPI0025C4BAC5|nr:MULTISPECIES: outer membrane protein assembly factor BamD [unclassified Dysgonomonas]MDR1715461.1 outer membrane protein assembly factor BamD [Prevotella sp.]MDR2002756.1 outer membrane protein assembly factor BamD [Prevotella sp.]HMM03648.1 outer membrane protein assembly factor BamD [Dysgonomonas sp.]